MDLKIKCTFLTTLYQASVSFCTHAGLSLWGGQIELHSVTSTCKARFHLQPLPLLSPLARPSLPQITVCLVPSHGSGRSSSNVTSSEMPYRATLAKIATLPCPRLWPCPVLIFIILLHAPVYLLCLCLLSICPTAM